ncbi:cyclic AMP-responsive element-binding protein 1-like isoform X2 [Amphibalanus amphitrite]|uniref:cyclic AMP-responsive element-binding protein 1-like isoform X2 n=1 Tax=Amphibalanus amphitrite TaxID=1232801 RepID=UPI001C905999|nr:cyclic AMP-responsive element-binding protein 1-like isoform X2 [Amphibalanus amphitrite]XP_043229396.1 cyclic AMP-responsive element-binding protein 1-like isoform X2 [Amphibalanus amphitrite]XP_043229397.1 cyclic AMP-responsive element-binding protein 1-like isoform X2 [Amphibalanus amphitrite]
MDSAAADGLSIAPDTPKDALDGQADANSPSVSRPPNNQPSVIQSTQPVQFSKNNVILLNKAGVIQTAPNSSVQSLQVVDAESLPAQYEDEAARRRREILTRRPSYRKILNELGGGEISEDKGDGDVDTQGAANYQGNGIIKVIPANTIQISGADGVQGLQTLSMSSAGTGGGNTIVQYTQGDGQFFVPVSIPVTGSLKLDQGSSQHMVLTSSGEVVGEEVTKKREVRLFKNREAARECRRKKKEYIKCLENRVAVLENQNKALIEELKSLKELYCQKKLP